MRRILLLVITLCVCNVLFAQIKIACIGNSITYGYGYNNPQSYPSQLDTLLGNDWEVKNFGKPGATMLRKADDPYYKLNVYADAKVYNPDVVIIKLGTNDSKPQNWIYKDDFVADYDSMITELKALPSKPFIILCTPVPAYSQGWGIRDSVIKEEMPLIQAIARENKLKLINLYEPLSNHSEWYQDGIHPNELGLAEMARVISEKVLSYKKEIMERESH
jgi:lysophospholipase L1-like esterase